MADREHVERLREGAGAWNAWREVNPTVQPNLEQADLRSLDLAGANLKHALLREADLRDTNLRRAFLIHADLGWIEERNVDGELVKLGADLRGADVREVRAWRASFNHAQLEGVAAEQAQMQAANVRNANMRGLRGSHLDGRHTDFSGCDLSGADLWSARLDAANLTGATLDGARLSKASLQGATLVGATLRRAILAETKVYGVSAWDVDLGDAQQKALVITRDDDPPVTVDDIETAQVVHLLLTNPKVSQLIDTMTSRLVLVLGRFSEERKGVLDAVRAELRDRGYVPVIFDFEGPASRDLTETVRALAHLSRFIVADISSPQSVVQELTTIVPTLLSVPVAPIIVASQEPYGMFGDLARHAHVLDLVKYDSTDSLLAKLDTEIIAPAEARVIEQRKSA